MKPGVTKELLNHADAIRKGAEVLAETINDWQVIRQYLTNRANNLQLTDLQQKKLDRYNFMYSQLASGKYIESEVVSMTARFHNISMQQAYQDLSSTKEIFATLFNFNKAFEIRIQLDLNRMMLQKAQESNDLKAYAALEKNRIAMQALLPEAEEADNSFEAHQNVIEFNPALIGAEEVDMQIVLAYINDKRKTKIKTDLFEEAPTPDDDRSETTLQ